MHPPFKLRNSNLKSDKCTFFPIDEIYGGERINCCNIVIVDIEHCKLCERCEWLHFVLMLNNIF